MLASSWSWCAGSEGGPLRGVSALAKGRGSAVSTVLGCAVRQDSNAFAGTEAAMYCSSMVQSWLSPAGCSALELPWFAGPSTARRLPRSTLGASGPPLGAGCEGKVAAAWEPSLSTN